MEEAKWYVVHTYSGYENKVKEDLIKAVENRNLQDMILEVKYPIEEVVEIKDGKRKVYQRKVFPGYVMVKMIMNDKTWYVVRNTRGVTGFVGPGSKPIPLSDEEVTAMGVERIPIELDIEVGESVRVVSGPLENFVGTVEAFPDLEALMDAVRDSGYHRVVLTPLMLVAGDHANNDMASDEPDSWKTRFTESGLPARAVIRGLGEYEKVLDLYQAHLDAIL